MGSHSEQQQYSVSLPALRREVPVAVIDGKVYYPLRLLCAALGVKAQMQIERVRSHEVLGKLTRQAMIRTRTGTRETWCLEKRGIGYWLGTIQVSSVRAEVRPAILDLQEQLLDAADKLLFGQVDSVTRLTLAIEQRVGSLEERVAVLETDEGDQRE